MTTTSSNGGVNNQNQPRRKSRPGSAKSNRSRSANDGRSITKIGLNNKFDNNATAAQKAKKKLANLQNKKPAGSSRLARLEKMYQELTELD